jgi:hypothetical protein
MYLESNLIIRGEMLKRTQFDKSGVSGLVAGAAIVVIIIVIIAAILVAYPSLLSGGDGGGSGDWEAGYYAEWNMNYGDAYYVSGQNWTQRWTVEDVNETRVLINVTTLMAWAFGPGDEPVYDYTHAVLVKNLSTMLTFDPEHLNSWQTPVLVGNESISTKWGSIECQHYNVTDDLTYDVWEQYYVWHGVVFKWTDGYRVILLIDANVPWFPSP